MKRGSAVIFRNLGLILQFNGLLYIVPAAFAIFSGEEPQAIAIFLGSFASLALGFMFSNVKGEEKLDYADLSILVVIAFILLGAVGSVPYLYLHQQLFPDQDIPTKVISSYFESISGITTTGITLFSDPAMLTKSIIFYRAVAQWLGGVGIVFFVLLFLNAPSKYQGALEAFGGFSKLATTSRGTFLHIMEIYAFYTALFTILLVTLGFMDPFAAVVTTMTGIATGGFTYTSNLGNDLNPMSFWLIIAVMVAGATSFPIHEALWRRKVRGIFSSEFKFFVVYLIVISTLTVALAGVQNLSETGTIVFHVFSAASTTGFQIGQLSSLNPATRFILTLVMFFGGCSFSTAGGIKFIRILVAFKSVPWLVKNNVLPASAITVVRVGKSVFFEKEIAYALMVIFTSATSILVGTAILTTTGATFLNSLFESISAFSNTGLSTGITNMSMPDLSKLVLVIEMMLGRIEVIPVLIVARALYLKIVATNL